MYIEKKPLFTLSIGEFMAMTRKMIEDTILENEEGEKRVLEKKQEKEQHFSIKELAEFLRCSIISIHMYKKKGLPFYRIGKKILFRKQEVLNYMKTLKNKRVTGS